MTYHSAELIVGVQHMFVVKGDCSSGCRKETNISQLFPSADIFHTLLSSLTIYRKENTNFHEGLESQRLSDLPF